MNFTNKILEKFGIELTKKNKLTLKQIIFMIIIVMVVFLLYSSAVFGYIGYDKFIKPTLQSTNS
jgi:flagellar biosynthesis/type III secretory pathway M-ring protein FliF/YscJ